MSIAHSCGWSLLGVGLEQSHPFLLQLLRSHIKHILSMVLRLKGNVICKNTRVTVQSQQLMYTASHIRNMFSHSINTAQTPQLHEKMPAGSFSATLWNLHCDTPEPVVYSLFRQFYVYSWFLHSKERPTPGSQLRDLFGHSLCGRHVLNKFCLHAMGCR